MRTIKEECLLAGATVPEDQKDAFEFGFYNGVLQGLSDHVKRIYSDEVVEVRRKELVNFFKMEKVINTKAKK